MLYQARVEYSNAGQWVFWKFIDASTAELAKERGLEEARSLWRNNVAGVKVTVISPEVVLERMR